MLTSIVSEAYIETSSNATTTRITSGDGGSTYYQPAVGVQTGGGSSSGSSGPSRSASSGAGSSAASGSGAVAAATSSRAAGDKVAFGMKGVWGLVGAVAAIGVGMRIVA